MKIASGTRARSTRGTAHARPRPRQHWNRTANGANREPLAPQYRFGSIATPSSRRAVEPSAAGRLSSTPHPSLVRRRTTHSNSSSSNSDKNRTAPASLLASTPTPTPTPRPTRRGLLPAAARYTHFVESSMSAMGAIQTGTRLREPKCRPSQPLRVRRLPCAGARFLHHGADPGPGPGPARPDLASRRCAP